MPALHKCDPERDSGYTKADNMDKTGNAFFCVYFSRGCCSEGKNCRYYHRIPIHDDCIGQKDNLKDIFGRTRHGSHKDDMTGIGSFNKECRTIFI
jgi:hypothetical protein